MIRAPNIVEVAVNVPLSRSFHYLVPPALAGQIERGHRVLVPFGGTTRTGVCVSFPPESDVPNLKPIQQLLHPDCRFDEHLLKLTRWIADYYRVGWGEVLEAALPPPIRSGKKERQVRFVRASRSTEELVAEAERLARRAPVQARILRFLASEPGPHPRADLLRRATASSEALRSTVRNGHVREDKAPAEVDVYAEEMSAEGRPTELTLSADQERALQAFRLARAAGGYRAILLHGVTGSGKTEVYLRALREVIAAGGRGLVLVPEISLTPQTVLRFRQGLKDTRVAVLHSMLSAAERTGEWRQIQQGKAKLVIGARSAAFAPIPDLRLIVVDEEHEPTYKQETSPRYHARDVAVMRAHLLGIPILLGSATPALESYFNAAAGKYQLVELPRRATAHDLPAITVVPLQPEFYRADGSGLVSDQLDYFVRKSLREHEQVLVYLNRRGFATFLHCIRCGFVLKCDHCDVSLTFHRRENLARCHYCGLRREAPTSCPDCEMPGPRKSGMGTEKVVSVLTDRYPEAHVARLDSDSVTTHRSLRDTITRFRRGDYDILVGTQMVAKGHDFPRVSLVGILSADTSLHFPDFRAAERTFQLITQVSGRAGRGRRPGRVIVQTFFPEHYAIGHAVAGDYRGFYQKELAFRQGLGYPPCGRLVKVLLSGTSEEKVLQEAQKLGERLREMNSGKCQILGPAASPISRLQNRYRAQILVKSRAASSLHDFLVGAEKALSGYSGRKSVDVSIDVDPQSML